MGFGYEDHVIFVDAECWKLILKGDYKFIDEKNEALDISEFSTEQLKQLEKNNRALKLITRGLSPLEKRMVLSSLISKDRWDSLAKIYQGSENVKKDRIITLP